MPLPAGIFESFQENPGTDLEATTGLSVLDTINENSPLARALGKSRKIISNQPLPEQNSSAPKSNYEFSEQPVRENYSEGGKEIPTTEELLQKIKAGRTNLNETQPNRTQPVQTYVQPQQPVYAAPQPASTVIDYSLINSMLKSIVEEQMKGLKSQLLTENKKSGVSEAAYFSVSNEGIRFIDKKGNIYESGKLKKVANIND